MVTCTIYRINSLRIRFISKLNCYCYEHFPELDFILNPIKSEIQYNWNPVNQNRINSGKN